METAKRFRDFYETSATNKAEEISVLEQGLREFKRMNKLDPKEIEALQLRQQTLDESVRLLQAERFSTNIPDEGRLFLLDQQIDMATNEAARLRAHIATLENLDAEYDVLSARLQTARNTYDYLLKLSEQSYVFAREFDPRNISIVDPASAPERPARPRRVINAFLGMVFGIILGVSVAFFAEYLDDTIKSPTDVETFLRMPFLGLIPALTKTISTALVENIVEQEPKGTVAEAYRAIRTNIIFSSDRPMRRLVITSSGPGEGKTTTAINIANVMARAGDRTLLIDADMRRPRIHKIFGLNGSVNGLSNYLVNNATTDNLFQPTRIEGLSVLTAGPIPPNPVELLNSPRLKELLDVAATQFDRIIIDTPPVIAVTDSAILSRLADAVILAVHGGRTHREVVKRAIDVLQNVGGRILGVLLNNVNIFRASYYDYYYYSYYRYAYGYKYGYTARRKGGAASRKAAASSKKT
jgi:capsular exopolysaccharide synthesis family protein